MEWWKLMCDPALVTHNYVSCASRFRCGSKGLTILPIGRYFDESHTEVFLLPRLLIRWSWWPEFHSGSWQRLKAPCTHVEVAFTEMFQRRDVTDVHQWYSQCGENTCMDACFRGNFNLHLKDASWILKNRVFPLHTKLTMLAFLYNF